MSSRDGEPEAQASPTLAPGAGAPLVAGPAASLLDAPPNPTGYLRSRRNLVGCAFAVVGVVLAFTGILGFFWPVAVVGLYGLGALLAPSLPGRRAVGSAGTPDLDEVRRALAAQVHSLSGRGSAEVMARVTRIQQLVLAMLPRAESMTAGSQDLFILRATALDYLPATLSPYMNLPRDYAVAHRLGDGRTAEADVLEQLALLESKLQEVSQDIARNDSDRLLANGRFLQDKFGARELKAPEPGDQAPPPR